MQRLERLWGVHAGSFWDAYSIIRYLVQPDLSELYETWHVLGLSRTGPLGSGSVGSGIYRGREVKGTEGV